MPCGAAALVSWIWMEHGRNFIAVLAFCENVVVLHAFPMFLGDINEPFFKAVKAKIGNSFFNPSPFVFESAFALLKQGTGILGLVHVLRNP